MTGRDTDADVPGGECDTRLDARQQMQPADVTEERCEICPLIGPSSESPAPPPKSWLSSAPCQAGNGVTNEA